MKPILLVVLIVAAAGLLSGCGAMGVLEEENVELRDKLDSLSSVQYGMKQRVQYLESENIDLDNKNKNLKERVTSSGGLTPPDYVITGKNPSYAPPAEVVPLYSTPQNGVSNTAQNTITVAPQGSGAPQTSSVGPNWGSNASTLQQSKDSRLESAPWRAERQAIQSGATKAHASDGNWNYGKSGKAQNQSKYAQRFDTRKSIERPEYSAPRSNIRGWQKPEAVQKPQTQIRRQGFVERQSQPSVRPQVRTNPAKTSEPLPPATVNASPQDMRRNAEYNYLEDYQRGLAAYKDGNYDESIQILRSVASRYSLNNMSDNCDYWIAESYLALGKDKSAKHYYGRVISYPTSDKKAGARKRITSLR